MLSHTEAGALSRLRGQAPTHNECNECIVHGGAISTNLGRDCTQRIHLLHDGICRPGETTALITWEQLARMSKKKRFGAFQIPADGSAPVRLSRLSESSGRALSLLPVDGAPASLLVAGFTMHRVAGSNPRDDTACKLRALGGRVSGAVLDVCTGLGYTAVACAHYASVHRVVTVERDEGVVQLARCNPWSAGLFTHAKIERVVGDAEEVLGKLDECGFDCVVHDPPAQVLAGRLYGLAFYQLLFRVCRPGAALFHYIGDPGSRESGRLFAGVRRRLAQAGFEDIVVAASAFGVLARRPA